MDKHVAMQGCVTWSGRSSMEIWIEVRIVRDPVAWASLSLEEKMRTVGRDAAADQQDVVLNAFFLMVARDAHTQRAACVPPLAVERMASQDLFRFRRGAESAVRRKKEAASSLQRVPPTAEEIELVHDLLIAGNGAAMNGQSGGGAGGSNSLLNTSTQGSVERAYRMSLSAFDPPLASAAAIPESSSSAAVVRPKLVAMADTEMSSLAMTQPQDRSVHGASGGARE